MARTGLYPGTFDPVTLGHVDIIKRAAKLVDRLYIGIAINRDKGPLFDLDERVAMIEKVARPIAAETGIEIIAHPFENLLIKCAREVNATVVIRGLRAVSDFEYEYQMASRLVKEIARLGGDVLHFVPDDVAEALAEKYKS